MDDNAAAVLQSKAFLELSEVLKKTEKNKFVQF
jgi:hypothetical protein